MSDRFNVLISSAGRRFGLLEAFRSALRDLGLDGGVFAADINPLSVAVQVADKAFLVPHCTAPDFVPRMIELSRENDVRLIVPTIQPELPVYAKHRKEFEAAGIVVAVSSEETIRIAADKVRTHSWLSKCGLPTVRQALAEDVLRSPAGWPFPLIAKPRAGSLSIGLARVGSVSTLAEVATNGGYIVQTIAPGVEFTIDLLANRQGEFVCAVPRQRLEVRGGEISKGITVRSASLEGLARRICEALPSPYGCLNVQVFFDEDTDTVNVIELNARFGGGYPLAFEAGANYPRWIIEEILGLPSTASADGWTDGLVMLRYDSAVYVDRGEVGM